MGVPMAQPTAGEDETRRYKRRFSNCLCGETPVCKVLRNTEKRQKVDEFCHIVVNILTM
jgi:hypothetical protein